MVNFCSTSNREVQRVASFRAKPAELSESRRTASSSRINVAGLQGTEIQCTGTTRDGVTVNVTAVVVP